MAEPYDSSLTMAALAEYLERQYFRKLLDMPKVTGVVTNALFEFDAEPVTDDGKYFKTERFAGDFFRGDTDALSDFRKASYYKAIEVKARWNPDSPSSHDFLKISGMVTLTEYQVNGMADEGSIVDVAEHTLGNMRKDFETKLAVYRRLPRSGQLGLVNGTPKNNDALVLSACSSYTTNSTTVRCGIDTCAVPMFQKGWVYDVYNSSGTLINDKVQCTDVRPEDPTGPNAAFAITSASVNTTFNGLADNHVFYLSDGYQKGMHSIESWNTLSASGFIGGVNRLTDPVYQGLNTNQLRQGLSATPQRINKSHFGDVAQVAALTMDKSIPGIAVCMAPDVHRSLRDQFEAAALIPWPSDSDARKRFANLGSMGLTYQDPALGMLSLQADPLMLNTIVDFYTLGHWRTLVYGQRNLKWMPGSLGKYWERMESTTPGGGPSMFYAAQAYANVCDYCLRPGEQFRLLYITP